MDLYQFLTTTNPPHYGHQLNHLESTGNVLLYPFAAAIGNFYIKDNSIISRICAIATLLLSLPLTIVGAVLKGIGYALPHKEILATDIHIQATSQIKLRQCYEISKTLSDICMREEFTRSQDGQLQPKFVMVSGTALGAVRHGGIIPWDDDCDFAIFQEDEEQFLRLKEALQEAGLEIRDLRFDSTYKIRFTNEKIKELYGDVSSSDIGEVDIFVFREMSDGCYTYDTRLSRSRWSTEFFTPEEVQRGFEMKQFGPPEKNLFLPLLKQPHEYLSRYYGENYTDYGIETHGHLCFDYGCGSVSIPFFKLDSHYFKIETWKNQHAVWA